MEIRIEHHNRNNKEISSESRSILSYKSIPVSTSLLLVNDSGMGTVDGDKRFFEIFKVQFLASCKIDTFENPVLIAFYIGEDGDLIPEIIFGLPNFYYQSSGRFFLIDYKSYCEICDWTGETRLSLAEYIKEIKDGRVGTNSFMEHGENLLNYNEQRKYYAENPV